MSDERKTTSLGPAGRALMRNVRRIREGQRLTYVELSERMATIGRPIPVLGLRRIERGERRIDVDDMLALAYALGVPPVHLIVPSDLDGTDPYGITPTVEATADAVIRWICGDAWMPDQADPTRPFDIPDPPWPVDDTWAARLVRWMPQERAERMFLEMAGRNLARREQERSTQEEGPDDGRPDQAD